MASPHHIFDALHLLLVAVAVLHGSFLRLLQRALQGLDPFGCGPETFLQFGKLTPQVCVVTYQLSNTHTRVSFYTTGHMHLVGYHVGYFIYFLHIIS